MQQVIRSCMMTSMTRNALSEVRKTGYDAKMQTVEFSETREPALVDATPPNQTLIYISNELVSDCHNILIYDETLHNPLSASLMI